MSSQPENTNATDEQRKLLSVAGLAASEIEPTRYGHVADVIRNLTAEIELLLNINQPILDENAPSLARKSSRTDIPDAVFVTKISARGRQIEDVEIPSPEEIAAKPQRHPAKYDEGDIIIFNDGDEVEPYLSDCRIVAVNWSNSKNSFVYKLDRMETGAERFSVKENAIEGLSTSDALILKY